MRSFLMASIAVTALTLFAASGAFAFEFVSQSSGNPEMFASDPDAQFESAAGATEGGLGPMDFGKDGSGLNLRPIYGHMWRMEDKPATSEQRDEASVTTTAPQP